MGRISLPGVALLLVFVGLLIAIVDAPPLSYTNQYNQSGEPFIAFGGAPSGDYNDLNVSGEGLTYNITEAQDGTLSFVAKYNFTDTINNKAYSKSTDDVGAGPLPWTNGWDGTEVTASAYTNLTSNDSVYANTFSTGNNDEPWMRFNFTLNMTLHPLSSIQWIYVEMDLIKVAGAAGETCTYTIANFTASNWDEWAAVATSSAADTYRAKNFTSDFGDIINSTNQLFLLTNGISMDTDEGCRIDFVNVSVGYQLPLYRVEVWHNSSPVSYIGDLTSVNATLRFNSTSAATYNLSIYNWTSMLWNYTPCQGVVVAANTNYSLWCNVTQSPTSYISSDNVVRISINNTAHLVNGTLKEDYVQFYVSYRDTVPPLWRNNGSNTTTPTENASVLLFAQGFDETFLEYAVLETNESGVFENKSGVYGSPMYQGIANTFNWSNFTWRNTSVVAGTQVCWRIWYNDSSSNLNVTDLNCFTVQGACSIALDLSQNLINPGINWSIENLPAVNESAWGNNGTGNTTYNTTIQATGCDANLWISANDHLRTDGLFIGLGNETYRWNRTNATVPGEGYTSLTTNDALITSPLSGTSEIYFKFFLNVSVGQAAGVYNNTVNFKANKTG